MDPDTGKILDIGIIGDYDDEGNPKYGCINVRRYYGNICKIHPYGFGPSFEEIQEIKKL